MTNLGLVLLYNNQEYHHINSFNIKNIINISKISFKYKYIIYKKNIPYTDLDIDKKPTKYADWNWAFKIINNDSINYFNYYDVSFGIWIGSPVDYLKVLSIVIIKENYQCTCTYNNKDKLLAYWLIDSYYWFIKKSSNDIKFIINNKHASLGNPIAFFIELSKTNKIIIKLNPESDVSFKDITPQISFNQKNITNY